MKNKILLTICMVLAAAPLANAAGASPADANKHVALAIVFDTSTTSSSTWTQLNVLARQSFSSLKADDRLILISATNGKPVVMANILIESPTSENQQRLNAKLASISRLFLARADLSNALAAAFDLLQSQPCDSKSCLVLTDGKHDSSQIQQIRRLAVAFKKMDWPLCITAAADANRRLFVAGSQGEMQVVTLDNANLPQWLETVRPHAAIKPLEVIPSVTEMPKPESPKTVFVPDLTFPIAKQTQVPDANSQIKTAFSTPPAVTKTSDAGTLPPTAIKSSAPVGTPSKTAGQTKATTPKSVFGKIHWFQILIILITVVLMAFVLFATSSHRRKAEKSVNNDSPSDDNAIHHLVAAMDSQEHDLGEENSIERLVFGSNPASAIPLVGEEIKDKEFEIWREDNGYEIHNFGTEELTFNGIPVKSSGHLELLLPATIQTATGLRISLFRQPVGKKPISVTDIGGQNNEDEQ